MDLNQSFLLGRGRPISSPSHPIAELDVYTVDVGPPYP